MTGAVQCNGLVQSGGEGDSAYTVELGRHNGTFQLFYDMYIVPDEMTIYYLGGIVFTTGGLVSGSRTLNVTYGLATSKATAVTVVMHAPTNGTAWEFSVSCPA